jgi:hypothetical protein
LGEDLWALRASDASSGKYFGFASNIRTYRTPFRTSIAREMLILCAWKSNSGVFQWKTNQIKVRSRMGLKQKENPSGPLPGPKKPNESGEQGSQGNEQQRRTPGREQEQGNEQRHGPGEGKKMKLETKEGVHKKSSPSSEGASPFPQWTKRRNTRISDGIQVRASGSAQNVVEAPTMRVDDVQVELNQH